MHNTANGAIESAAARSTAKTSALRSHAWLVVLAPALKFQRIAQTRDLARNNH